MPEFCKVEKDGKITTVTINRPKVMNALHPAANRELGEVFDDFCADPSQWIAIITGAGERAFSAGNDLKHTASGGGGVEMMSRGFGGLTSRYDNDKPIIAAVNGVAMGGGFEIALACDLIIASDNARFALPEPKVGLAALAGGLHVANLVYLARANGCAAPSLVCPEDREIFRGGEESRMPRNTTHKECTGIMYFASQPT